jgi:hypothetical protein
MNSRRCNALALIQVHLRNLCHRRLRFSKAGIDTFSGRLLKSFLITHEAQPSLEKLEPQISQMNADSLSKSVGGKRNARKS